MLQPPPLHLGVNHFLCRHMHTYTVRGCRGVGCREGHLSAEQKGLLFLVTGASFLLTWLHQASSQQAPSRGPALALQPPSPHWDTGRHILCTSSIQPAHTLQKFLSHPISCWADQLQLPRWCTGKESVCQGGRCKRHGFNPWVRKIPWRSKWQPSPVFLSGESHGQRSLAGYRATHRVTRSRA